MMRQTVKTLSAIERDMLEPHLEAVRRYERVVRALGPQEEGVHFDPQMCSYYRIVPAPSREEVASTNGRAKEWQKE